MSLSDPLVCAGLLLAFAGLILVVGLALQASSNGSRRRSFWQEMAGGHRDDEGREAPQAPVQAPVTNDRPPEDQPATQELDTRVQAFDSVTPTTAAISAIDDLEERLNTWIGRIEAGIAPAPVPVANEQAPEPVANEQAPEPVANEQAPEPVANEQAPEPVANEQAPEPVANQQAREPVANQQAREPVANQQAPEPVADEQAQEGQRWLEEPAGANGSGANGSDGDGAPIAPARDVAGEDGIQDNDRRWLEEFLARTKTAEESCGRADETAARVTRLIVPPPSRPAE